AGCPYRTSPPEAGNVGLGCVRLLGLRLLLLDRAGDRLGARASGGGRFDAVLTTPGAGSVRRTWSIGRHPARLTGPRRLPRGLRVSRPGAESFGVLLRLRAFRSTLVPRLCRLRTRELIARVVLVANVLPEA